MSAAQRAGLRINFDDLYRKLLEDPTLQLDQAVVARMSTAMQSYQAGQLQKGELFKLFKEVFGPARIKEGIKSLSSTAQCAAGGSGSAAESAPRPATTAVTRNPMPMMPPLPEVAADASRKRPAPAASPGGGDAVGSGSGASGGGVAAKRARVATADGYACAAAASDGAVLASVTGTRRGEDAEKETKDLGSGFDIFQVAGVDVSQEEEALGGSRGGVADAAAAAVAEQPWGERVATEAMVGKLRGVCEQCGVQDVDGGAARLLSEGLGERLSLLLGALRPTAEHRAGTRKQCFGPRQFVVTLDPKVPWRQRVVAEARHAVRPVAGNEARQPPARRPPAAAPAVAAGGGREEERVLSRLSVADGAAAPEPVAPTTVLASDVLHLLESERQTSRSRVLQWWRCAGKPLKRSARHAARLYTTPPRMPGAAEEAEGEVAGQP
mmetsp:Transcript_20727/g.66889  ORF Transcript_20727/g.66889 Transcript_20727/m.66889 type:complete len:439 (-) Transcript_20727:119-1435(-)